MIKYATRWAFALGALICLLTTATPSFAKEVPLEEVSLSLHNKPVTGFRLVLDRSERYVANQIIAHVATSDNSSPFQYERSIIYENIRYEPIVDDRDISLYYLLKSIQGQYTELTLVAMYDYRRAISTREFPALALKLQIDLAKLVRHVTGDVMKAGDVVYDDATLAKLEEEPAPMVTPDPLPVVEHFKEEEVDNNAVLLRKDPFKPSKGNETKDEKDAQIQELALRVQALELREQELVALDAARREEIAAMERKQSILQAKVKENKSLRDSIVLLSQRIEALIGQAYVADDVSVSNETAAEIDRLEKENVRMQRELEQLHAENDSLYKVSKEQGLQLNRLSAGGASITNELASISADNKRLKEQVEEYKARMALQGNDGQGAADSLLGLLSQAQSQNKGLQEDNERQNRNLGRLKQENEELSSKKMQLEERMATLEYENRSLREGHADALAQMPDQNLVDSLIGEVHAMRRSSGISKAELTQVRADMEALRKEKDAQEQQLFAAQKEQKNLQARIESLQAAGNSEGGSVQRTPANADLQDSLLLMRQQLVQAQARAAEATAAQQALTQAETQLKIRERELRTAQTELQAKSTELAEAQKSKAVLQKSLNEANARLADSQNAGGSAQQELNRLQQENRALSTNLGTKDQQLGKLTAENKTLNDSIAAVRAQRASLRKDIEARDRTLRQQIQRRDSLQSQLADAAHRENELQRDLAAVQSRVDSLARVRVPEGEQARYLKEQRQKLEQLEKDLEARDLSAADREKLVTQREAVLQRKEADFAVAEDRFKDLEAREKRLQLLEQQLNAREGVAATESAPVQMREGKVVEFGAQVPVFIVESTAGLKTVQRQVVGYMLSRDELYDHSFPDILYRAARLAELDTEPVEIKVRLDPKSGGTTLQISIRLDNGEYISSEKYRDRQDAVKQLISKMLRYKV